eukprot:gene20108-22079_t
MGSCQQIRERSVYGRGATFQRKFCKERFSKCKSLYRKDLDGHYGCVNALDFCKDGTWLVSGGDDRRVLLWDFSKAKQQNKCKPILMKTEHQSNIFCTVFDNHTDHILSSGNDERVIRHNINRREAVNHFHHEEAVYCISLPNQDENIFATAGEGGAVLVWDVRIPEGNKVCLAISSSSFHGVSFNPFEPRLIVTANSHDGATLYDLRYPERPMINYGSPGKQKSAMFVKFNQLGTQILALVRRTGPILYNIHEKKPLVEFSHADYSNVCTMKSSCFMGDSDQYVAAGSDDFNVYIWENPGNNWQDTVVKDPFMILEGHRSIVNQVRYNNYAQTLVTSGVEKCIKLWSQFKMEGCLGSITAAYKQQKRPLYSHDQYMEFIVDTGEPLSHDYDMQSTEEDPRMIAFFDSLIRRVNAGWFSEDLSSDEDSQMDNVLLRIFDEPGGGANASRDGDNLTIMDLRRLYRSNRRLLMERLEEREEMYYDVISDSDESSQSEIGLQELFSLSQDSDTNSFTDHDDDEINHAEMTNLNNQSTNRVDGIVTTDFSEATPQATIPGTVKLFPGKIDVNGAMQSRDESNAENRECTLNECDRRPRPCSSKQNDIVCEIANDNYEKCKIDLNSEPPDGATCKHESSLENRKYKNTNDGASMSGTCGGAKCKVKLESNDNEHSSGSDNDDTIGNEHQSFKKCKGYRERKYRKRKKK